MQSDVVEKAYDELLKTGLTPSVRLVRQYIGHGSFQDINRLLGAIRSSREAEGNAALNLPLELQEKCDRFVTQLWAALSAQAEASVVIVREQADVRTRELGQELSTALADADHLQSEVDSLAAIQSSLSKELEATREEGFRISTDLAIAQTRLQDFEQQIAALHRTLDLALASRPKADATQAISQRLDLTAVQRDLVYNVLEQRISRGWDVNVERLGEITEFGQFGPPSLSTFVQELVEDGQLSLGQFGMLTIPKAATKRHRTGQAKELS